MKKIVLFTGLLVILGGLLFFSYRYIGGLTPISPFSLSKKTQQPTFQAPTQALVEDDQVITKTESEIKKPADVNKVVKEVDQALDSIKNDESDMNFDF